jgi:putative ABC transport system permease protein
MTILQSLLATGSWLLATSYHSLRTLLRSPGFALAAVLTLALGIGANTAIFSVVDAVLLRPLPYPDSDRLVMVWDKLVKYKLPRRSPEYHTADAYRRLTNIFDLTGGIFWGDTTLTGGNAERVSYMTVSPEIFEMLAPRAVAGRIFAPEEYRADAEPTVVLGNSLFARHFGGDPSVLGKSLNVSGRTRRVIGVMAPDFDFNMRAGDIDLWIPVPLDTRLSWGNATRMLARLRPGVSLAAAQSALSTAAKHVDETEHPYQGPHGEDAGYGVTVNTLHEQFLGEYRTLTLLLLGAVAVVLLIACVNVANLMLVRAVSREKETAVRRALGATDARLMGQWLTESAILALAGSVLGTFAAIWGVKLLAALSPAASNALNQSAHRIGSGVARIGIDARALAFTLAISCLVCLLFGLAPSLASVRMTWGTRGTTRHSRRAASLLVTAEVALAFMLMIGAGLLLKSFSRLTHVDPGFNPSHLLILRTEFNRNTSRAERVTFYQDLREKLAAIPGVTSATMGDLPVGGGGVNAGAGDPFGIKGKSYDAANQFASLSAAGADYFRTFEIPMRAGRAFTASDSIAANVGVEAAKEYPSVVIVNETLARTFYPDGAVGQQIGVPPPCRDTKCDFVWMTIVGVVGDVKTRGLDMPARPQIYIPQPQTGGVILRTAGDAMAMARTASSAIRSADPDVAVFDVRTMEDRISQTVTQPRFQTVIVSFFAAAALFLAAIGIFAVVAHSTAQRTQEIGIRMALGADRGQVVQTVLFDGLRPVLFGVVLGLAGALAFSRILASVLFNVASTDPATFLLAAALLTAVAIAACLGPAQRATKVDPMIALRAE